MKQRNCFECVNYATHWFFPQGWSPCCDLNHSYFPVANDCKDFAPTKPMNEEPKRSCDGMRRERSYLNARELLDNPYPLNLSKDFDGGCPCCMITGQNFLVLVHCWRAFCVYGCEFSGIHVVGSLPKEELQQIAKHIRNNNAWSDVTYWDVTIKWLNESEYSEIDESEIDENAHRMDSFHYR